MAEVEATAELEARCEVLLETLRSVPIPGMKEPMTRFQERMNEWLSGPYRIVTMAPAKPYRGAPIDELVMILGDALKKEPQA